jgi:hypothetical protein
MPDDNDDRNDRDAYLRLDVVAVFVSVVIAYGFPSARHAWLLSRT